VDQPASVTPPADIPATPDSPVVVVPVDTTAIPDQPASVTPPAEIPAIVDQPASVVPPAEIPAIVDQPASVVPPAEIPAIVDQPASVAPPAEIPAIVDQPASVAPSADIPAIVDQPASVAPPADIPATPDSPVVVVPVDIPAIVDQPASVAPPADIPAIVDQPASVAPPADIPAIVDQPASVAPPADIPAIVDQPASVAPPADIPAIVDQPASVAPPADIPAIVDQPASVATSTTTSPDSPDAVVPADIPAIVDQPASVTPPADIPAIVDQPASVATSTTTSPDSPDAVVPADIPAIVDQPASVAPPADIPAIVDQPASVAPPADIPAIVDQPTSVAQPADIPAIVDQPASVVQPADIPAIVDQPASVVTSTNASPTQPATVAATSTTAIPAEPATVVTSTNASSTQPATVAATSTTASPTQPATVAATSTTASQTQPATVATSTNASVAQPAIVTPTSPTATPAQPATGTPAVAKPAPTPVRFDFPVANQPLVGVISTGFTANNPDIDYSRIALGQDRVAGDANPLMQPTEGSAPGTHVLGIIGATQGNNKGIDGINDDAPLWVGRAPATSDKWAESLKEFVDAAKQSAQPNAVVNINLNLTETTPQGQVVPRSQLTAAEKEALAYAQQNKVLVVVAAGNDPQQISALGNAGLDFDNIITVGSGNRTGKTDYSGTGEALDIVAEGGTRSNPVLSTVGTSTGNMAGTSVAAAQVTGAVSQVWAANPQLNYRQVVDIVKNTATDLGQPNWDAQTGAGLLNMPAAVQLAKVTTPEPFVPNTQMPVDSPSGVFAVGETGKVAIDLLFNNSQTQGELAIFSLEGMEQLQPGSPAFVQEAARRALSGSELGHVVVSGQLEGGRFSGDLGQEKAGAGEYQGVKTFDMRPGDKFAVMLVPNGSVRDVAPASSTASPTVPVSPIFSIPQANPNAKEQIADLVGSGQTFGMQNATGSRAGGEFNDIIFRVDGATGKAPAIPTNVIGGNSWRETEVWHQITARALSEDLTPVIAPVANFALTPEQPSRTIDLSQVFSDPEKGELRYEIVAGNSQSLSVSLQENRLNLTSLPSAGLTEVAIRATDAAGNSVTHTFSVTSSNLNQQAVASINSALAGLQAALNQDPEDFTVGLESPEGEEVLAQLAGTLEENPELIQLLARPESLSQMGLSDTGIATLQQLLQSPDLAEEMGLPVTLGEALSQPDSTFLDGFLLNADEAADLLPADAQQPAVGFLDFSGGHGENVAQIFASVNPLASYDTLQVAGGNWAQQLVRFVDKVRAAGESHGIANLSFDLSQLDDIGDTTRYELTPAEQQAIQYARDNNVLLVVAAGNTGDKMSALGAAAQKFDNIITVGAVNQSEQRADYSGYGEGLSIMAAGGAWQDEPNAFVGTSRATPYVTAAASLVWAANPGLSYQQVKQLLLETAADLDAPGWDPQTGAGLLDVKEAIRRAFLVEPLTPQPPLPQGERGSSTLTPFSGEGRVRVLARPASEATEAAIAQLQNTQQDLLDQWQVLADLGNPDLTLAELQSEVGQKIAGAFDKYQQVSTDAAIAAAQAQQWAEALALATSHYQIEQARLQELQARQKQLEEQLAGLGQQKTALEAETQQLLDGIKQQIAQAESDLARATAKLSNPFADVDDNLQTNSTPWRNAAARQQQLAQSFQQQAWGFAAQQQHYAAVAAGINPNRWQVVGHQRRLSGRQKEIWGLGTNPNLVKQKNQLNWQAGIAAQNRQALTQLAQQAQQQAATLNQYAQFLDDRRNSLNVGQANAEDAWRILAFLEQQAAQQENIAQKYSQLGALAEQRRQSNQNTANGHNSQINRWEVVGSRRKGSGKREDVYGWVHYPEHIAPRNQAQQAANQAAYERTVYNQLAGAAQQQAIALRQQVEKLRVRLRDWPVLKQGIDYEIAADALRLQAEKDLLAMHEPVQEQKLETLNLQISQAQSELQALSAEKLPAQQQLAGAAEQRLQETLAEVRAIQEERAEKAGDLQNFLETAGFLLPYRERLAVVQKNIEQLEDERLQVQFTMQEIVSQLAKTPSDTLRQQLNHWSGYLKTLEQELAWANLQKDQLALAVADSPERLAISALIEELEKAKAAGAGGTPVLQEAQHYINFLRGIEGSGANFLEGFDNLTERLAAAKTEQAQTEAALYALKDEYVKLGLEKADLEDNQIPAKEKAIADKEREITGTQGAIAETETSLAALQEELPSVVEMQSIASQSLAQLEQALAATQSQFAGIQNQIAGTQSQIQQQQAVLQGYQNQINQAYAAANWWEQQRQAHQNAANYWNGQIRTWGIIGSKSGKCGKKESVYGWVYNPQAEANRNAEQAAANNAAWQRDVASQQAQQLSASLQPQIAATQQQIATLQQQLQSLTQQQQQALQNQVSAETQNVVSARQQLQALTQQVNSLQSQIQQQQQNLDGLNAQLQAQQQQRDTLNSELANLKEQVPVLEQQLIDKYRQIELADKYLSQVEGEVNRLDSRLDLLNRAGVLEQQYQDNWQQWQSAAQEQAAATQALLATREAGAPARQQLESLQSQLSQAQANLNKANTLQQSIADTQQALSFTQLQLGNQRLQLQSLIDRDGPLAAAERYYLNLAEQHRQKMWYWNGSSYVYNAGEAAAYRSYLQQASFIADQRNQLWQQRRQTEKTIGELQQKAAQQQAQIASQQVQLGALGSIPQLQAQVAGLQANINTVAKALEPLQLQENRQTQAMQAATAKAQNSATGAAQTAELQAEALRQLIGFGMLASESDVDFFATEVEPKVNSYLEKLQQRVDSLAQTRSMASAQQASWEQQLANTTDPVSKQALTNLINQSKAQVDSLEALKDVQARHVSSLQDLLNQARASLTPLRQKQELEIRQKLESNGGRLQALESLLNSENAAEAVQNTGTVLAHAQLADQIRQDLTDNVSRWTEQLLDGHQMTKDLGSRQQNLSQSVDELIAYIEGNFADPHGDYHSSEADLRDGITTLGVLENRADDFDTTFTSTEDAIERIKLRLAQDAALWEEIAPIAIRYGVESQQLKEYLQMPGDAKTRWAAFLAKYPDNGTAIDLLQAATLEGRNPQWQISQQLNAPNADTLLNAGAVEGRNPLQALFDKAKAGQASHEAQGYAALAQAAWYEQRAAYHWAVSRKQGPTWTEWRRVCKRRLFRRKKCWDEAVTHVDHDWIIWRQYSQIFPKLRAQGYAHLVEADKWRKAKDRLEPLKNQWIEANDAANEAAPAVREARNFFAQLEAARADIPQAQTQLESLETLLPTLKQQLEQAEAEAKAQNAKVQQEWADYDADAEDYRQAIEDVLQRRGELNRQAIETQQQLAETEQWVERQTVALDVEARQVASLQQNLQQYRDELAAEIPAATGDELAELQAKLAQIDQSLQLASNKAAVLSAQQAALTQKRTLLTAQNEVILAEQRLLDAYISDPDADTGNLQQQLQDARAALAEAQRLAEQAEAASKALTAPLQQLQADLLAQNDEHLKQAKEHQAILKALLEATQLNANYTLQAAQKQQEVNSQELKILQRLQEAAAAGYQEAKALLDVAQHNDMATAAEIYYRDYSDLASDKGNKCVPGLARPEDRLLADQYYRQMLEQRELQRRAQAQADGFRAVKETAQAQMQVLEQQQKIAAQQLSEINAKVAETQAQREAKEQELAIAQARLDGISRIREQTEQTFNQLVVLEQLNLAQAQLEQEIAKNREADIDEAVRNRQERDRLELERRRLETQARIEQLRQLQVEDNLRQSLNQARGQLGLETLEGTDEPVQLQSQLASLLENLKNLESEQPDLPADVKALLAEARGDIYLALQGKEASAIQENLLKTMGGLIGQIEQYKSEINRIDLEEQWDSQLLQQAEQDLQGASQQFLKELERSAALQGERDVIDPLYLEALNKVAYAEQAVDISEDMAKQGKEMLEQIIKQRIAQRKLRKKMFWMKVLGIISGVIGILATIASLGGLTPLAIGLTAASAGINAIQSIINGDWLGGIFSIVMAGVGAFGSSLGNAIQAVGSAASATVWGMGLQTAKNLLTGIRVLQSIGSGVFSGVRSIMSGQGVMGALNILSGIAGAGAAWMKNILNECSSMLQKTMSAVFNTLKDAPVNIYQGIQGMKNGDWFGAIGNLFNAAISMGSNFAGIFNDTASQVFDYLGKAGNTVLAIGGAIKDGGIESWLSGINSVIGLWGDDIKDLVDKISGKEECVSCPEEGDPWAEENFDEEVDAETDDMFGLLEDEDILLEDGTGEEWPFDSQVPEGYNLSPEWVAWLNENPGYLVAGDLPDDQLWTILDGTEGNQQPETVFTSEVTSGITSADIKVGNKTVHLSAVGPNGEPVPIDPNKPTVFVTHGYISSGKAVSRLADAYKDRYPDYNVIILDWRDLAKNGVIPVLPIGSEYRQAAGNTKLVGNLLGQAILDLGIDPQQTTLIGHSLGARVSQYAADYVRQHSENGSLINNLVLLDPAGPGFQPGLWNSISGGYHRLPQGHIANNVRAIHSTTVWGDERRISPNDIYIKVSDKIPNAQVGEHSYPIKYLENLVRLQLDFKKLNINYASP
jgi:chromosome segregation ATPase/pimeloyl-ACP methyl ester carboxylesterase